MKMSGSLFKATAIKPASRQEVETIRSISYEQITPHMRAQKDAWVSWMIGELNATFPGDTQAEVNRAMVVAMQQDLADLEDLFVGR